MKDKNFYVYVHRRATDGAIFYVGKGKRARLTSAKNRNIWWQRTADKYGWTAQKIFQNLTEECALSIEKMLIATLRDQLSNITDGGQGVSGLCHSEKTKSQLKALADKQWSDECAREKRRLQTLAQWQEPGMRDRLKEAARKRWDRPDQRAMIAAIQRGKKQSPDHAAKSRIAKMGKPVSEETRAKLRAAWVIRKEKARAL